MIPRIFIQGVGIQLEFHENRGIEKQSLGWIMDQTRDL